MEKEITIKADEINVKKEKEIITEEDFSKILEEIKNELNKKFQNKKNQLIETIINSNKEKYKEMMEGHEGMTKEYEGIDDKQYKNIVWSLIFNSIKAEIENTTEEKDDKEKGAEE
jgi:HSP90 family molecular chaperone